MIAASLTEYQHQDRQEGQQHQVVGHDSGFADNFQSAKDEVAAAVRFEVRVLQLKDNGAVRDPIEVAVLQLVLRRLDAVVEQSPRFVT